MTVEVRADRDQCIGSENCCRWAPNTFGIDAEGKVQLLPSGGDPDDSVVNAVEGCPVSALSIDLDRQ